LNSLQNKELKYRATAGVLYFPSFCLKFTKGEEASLVSTLHGEDIHIDNKHPKSEMPAAASFSGERCVLVRQRTDAKRLCAPTRVV
jgi:hypothetical protein